MGVRVTRDHVTTEGRLAFLSARRLTFCAQPQASKRQESPQSRAGPTCDTAGNPDTSNDTKAAPNTTGAKRDTLNTVDLVTYA